MGQGNKIANSSLPAVADMEVTSAPVVSGPLGETGPRPVSESRITTWLREPKVSLRGLIELGGACTAALYVVLSVFYDRFYARLAIEPADVGLDRTAVISRALGGVGTIAGVIVMAAASLLAMNTIYSLLAALGDLMMRKALRKLAESSERRAEERLEILRGKAWVKFLGAVVPLPGISDPKKHPIPNRVDVFATVVAAGLIGTTIVLINGWSQVSASSEAAAAGRTVTPVTFAGLRVLDVKSRPCTAEWLGSKDSTPQALRSPDLHCLGQANGLAVFRIGSATITVPAGQVVLTLR